MSVWHSEYSQYYCYFFSLLHWGGVFGFLDLLLRKSVEASIKYLKNGWLNNRWKNDELFKQCLSHLLFLGLLPVIQEKQRSGQEKHAPQDDDKGTEHEGIAQTEEPPQRWRSVALLKGIRDLQPAQTHSDTHPPPSPKPPHIRTRTNTQEKRNFIQTNHPAKVLKISCNALTHYMALCCSHTRTERFTRVSSACFIIATDKTHGVM